MVRTMSSDYRSMLLSTYDEIVDEYVRREFDSPVMEKHYKRFLRDLAPGGLLYLGILEGEGERMMPEPYNRNLMQYFVFVPKSEIEKALGNSGFELLSYEVEAFDEEGDIFSVASLFAKKPRKIELKEFLRADGL